MIGEIDYAAANAGLSIAGAWAAARAPFPVKTVCWPTWERLGGMIKNFDVTLSYMSALDVDEGVYRWKRELLGAESGESVFVGRVGKALFPAHVKGFPPSPACRTSASSTRTSTTSARRGASGRSTRSSRRARCGRRLPRRCRTSASAASRRCR